MTINQLNNTCENNFTVTANAGATTRSIAAINAANVPGAYAQVAAHVGGAASGNPIFTASTAAAGAPTWTWGLDNAHGQKWALGYNTDVGTANDVIQTYPAGQVVFPLQPGFSVYVNNTIPNVTGDDSLYHIVYDTAITNIGGCYNFGTSSFVAPVTGWYNFSFCTMLSNGTKITASATGLIVGALNFGFSSYNANTTTVYAFTSGSINAFMNQGETAYVVLGAIDTAGKVDAIQGWTVGGGFRNFFTGCLLH